MATALLQHGIEPDVLVGTSVGALNAAYLAGPCTTGERLASLAALWSGMRRRDLFSLQPQRWVQATLGTAPSMFSGDPLRLLLARHLATTRSRTPGCPCTSRPPTSSPVPASSSAADRCSTRCEPAPPCPDCSRPSTSVGERWSTAPLGTRARSLTRTAAAWRRSTCFPLVTRAPEGHHGPPWRPRSRPSALSFTDSRRRGPRLQRSRPPARRPATVSARDLARRLHPRRLPAAPRTSRHRRLAEAPHRPGTCPATDYGVLAFHGPHEEPQEPPHPSPTALGQKKANRS